MDSTYSQGRLLIQNSISSKFEIQFLEEQHMEEVWNDLILSRVKIGQAVLTVRHL